MAAISFYSLSQSGDGPYDEALRVKLDPLSEDESESLAIWDQSLDIVHTG